MSKLTEVAIKKAKPEIKPYKMSDGGGMYLEVMPNGSKYWRLKYRFGGKEKRLALGVYPAAKMPAGYWLTMPTPALSNKLRNKKSRKYWKLPKTASETSPPNFTK